jgi:hypothetical protein
MAKHGRSQRLIRFSFENRTAFQQGLAAIA